MKNLMVYISPLNNFSENKNYEWASETEVLVKIQIENSLSLGWKPEEIILITNFAYEYMGVKAMVVSNNLFCDIKPTATKILVILYLFEKGIIGNDLWWFHDLDAFQLEPFSESELDLGNLPFALTDYGKTTINEFRDRRWSTGTIFFTKESMPIFEMIKDKIYQYQCNEEVALLALTRRNRNNINDLVKKINITYNLATRKRDVSASYEMADKPLKVIHFHPFDKRPVELGYNNIDVCVFGKNKLGKVLINDRLKNLFIKYKII